MYDRLVRSKDGFHIMPFDISQGIWSRTFTLAQYRKGYFFHKSGLYQFVTKFLGKEKILDRP